MCVRVCECECEGEYASASVGLNDSPRVLRSDHVAHSAGIKVYVFRKDDPDSQILSGFFEGLI